MRMGPIERRGQSRAPAKLWHLLLVAMALAVGVVLGRPTRALAFRMEPLVAVDVDGGQVDLAHEYAEGYVVVIGGRPTCPNTRNVVGQALGLPGMVNDVPYRVLVLDCDARPGAFRSGFGGKGTELVRFHTSLAEHRDGGNPNNRWLWSQYRGCGRDGSTLTLPFVFLLRQGEYLKCSNGRLDLAEFIRSGIDPDRPSGGGAPDGSLPVHRLYNPHTGEHLFTTDANERAVLSSPTYGWTYEGIAWTAPAAGTDPVYRLFNRWSGEHLFTREADEYATLERAGWRGEGVKFHSGPPSGKAVYRLFNPYESGAKSHHYTSDANEVRTLVGWGWRDEGVCMRGL